MTREDTMPQDRTEADSAPRWLDDQEQHAWRTFIYSVNTLLGELSVALESDPRIDLALGEYEILVRLSEAPGRTLRMSELADLVVHSRSRLTHTITRMEKRGLVERMRCEADGRGREAVLTDQGMALLERAAPVHVESVRALLLDRVGREGFLELGRILEAVVPDEETGCSKAPLVP